MERVWYVAYGSNLGLGRFRCYLAGGRPTGGNRTYEGCRDPSDPVDNVGLQLPGRLSFAGQSRVWSGGMAFYDVDGAGTVACRAYLITLEQFADVVAQEMRHPPGGRFASEFAESLPSVRTLHTHGPGSYETVHRVGVRQGVPLMTVTSENVAALTLAVPSAPYLWWIAAGLREAHGWTDAESARYLVNAPGARGFWQVDDVLALIQGATPAQGSTSQPGQRMSGD